MILGIFTFLIQYFDSHWSPTQMIRCTYSPNTTLTQLDFWATLISIIRVPFTGSVRLRSLLLKTGPGDQTPSKVVVVIMFLE